MACVGRRPGEGPGVAQGRARLLELSKLGKASPRVMRSLGTLEAEPLHSRHLSMSRSPVWGMGQMGEPQGR